MSIDMKKTDAVSGGAVEMDINRLPSITWHSLRINDKRVLLSPVSKEGSYRLMSGTAVTEAEYSGREDAAALTASFEDIASAMGSDFVKLVNGENVAPILFETDTKEDVSIGFNFDDAEQSINRVRLHAKEGARISCFMEFRSSSASVGGDSAAYKDGVDKDSASNQKRRAGIVETRIIAEKGAKVHLYQIHRLSDDFDFYNDISGDFAEDASFRVVHVLVSGKNINIGCAADLSGDRAHIKAYTGYLVTGDDELDMNYVVRHHGKETECEMLAKGALRDNAKKTYRATIDFIKGCAGAKGQENEEVLLLSDDVVNKTIPNILCAEEEVEGEHGASIGQLSDEILYYMQSRGIPEDTAYEMMARSGVSAAAGRIPTRFTETAD